MSVLDKLKFWEKPNKGLSYADSLDGYTPIFSQFGNDIYASDVVQQAIRCIVDEMKKLKPTHVREQGNDITTVQGSIQRTLENPNEFMTTADFIEKITWNLFLNCNSFVYPAFATYTDEKGKESRMLIGLYPLQPSFVEFQKDRGGNLYIEFRFANGYKAVIPYDQIIHIRKNYNTNEYMGGNKMGQPDNSALLKTLQINEDMLTGISKAMQMSYAINGVVKYNSMLDDGTVERNLKEFEKKLRASQSGFLGLDIKNEILPFQREIKLVDKDTLEFIDQKILRNWGVPVCILSGDYTKAQYEAFYQKTLEPLIITYSQAFQRGIFTILQRSHGNNIKFYPKDLIFMSVSETLEMVRLLGDSGALYENEKRVAFGLRPLPELEGKRTQSLNYVDVDLAAKYQLQDSKLSKGGNRDGKEE